MQIRAFFTTGVFTTILSLPASAQAPAACEVVGQLTVGDWVEYSLQGMPQVGTALRFEYLADVDIDGQSHRQYSWTLLGAENQRTGGAELFIKAPYGVFDITQTSRGMLEIPGQPPIPVTPDFIPFLEQIVATQGLDIDRQCATATVVGTENLTLPVGTVETTHLRAPNGAEIWVSDSYPLGIVQANLPTGGTMRLEESGRN